MNSINHVALAASLALMCAMPAQAQQQSVIDSLSARIAKLERRTGRIENFHRRLSIGGYGEAVMTRNFYSQHFNKYIDPASYKDDDSHGRVDLPHVVINLGYDFGHGWTMGMEVEFEHGGTESAVEIDADESGEYEAETEKGGEVALEQFWLNYEFCPWLNVKAGEIIVPVGYSNQYHMPNEFFTVYRPEGESSILPNTWHQVGISLWGRTPQWRYEAQFLSGLDSERFGHDCFVHYGSTSCYEFKMANAYAGALRIDNYSVEGLRIGVSGYCGNSFNNTMRSHNAEKYADCTGTLSIGSADFTLDRWNWIVRGHCTYAHLSDAQLITTFNNSFPKHNQQDGSPSKRQPIGSNALMYGAEAGYDIFSQIPATRSKGQKLYVFGLYEYYNSMEAGVQKAAYEWCKKNRFAVGFNYMPLSKIIIKGEYSYRSLPDPYNNEPSVSLGITYTGWFD